MIITHGFSKQRKAFSLVEVMVATALLGLLLTGLTSTFIFMLRSSVSLGNYADMNRDGSYFLEKFGREIRMTEDVVAISTSSFTLDIDNANSDETVTYTYDASSGNLIRYSDTNGTKEAMLNGISSLTIEYYNILGQITTNINEVKAIQLRVDLTRDNMRSENTDHIISARYNMRNRIITN
ncbi:prepilin-type N-terminal cleavage/methylation domain-containing protein [Cerasicoccus maritimus]|uniref:prepilin-type N-terminal cleavage/methylation domain-containing protein n=1 Tax=Cerasicoccus maritimus TaxID=490089 RepID=UPI002852A6A8|nr:prepilin-type N-terminal cleavage/methylation domain-containing protein [Cerasicoccus maritimus]